MKKLVVGILILVLVLGLVACGGGGNGGGDTNATRVESNSNDFDWETDGDGLTVSFIGGVGDLGVQHERWTYEISGNTLTVTSRVTGESFSYIRAS